MQAFADHNYEAALLVAKDLIREGTRVPIHMVFVLSAQHLGRHELAQTTGDQTLQRISNLPWHQALLSMILGRIDPAETLSRAQTDEQRCQANYYIGARHLAERDLKTARQFFETSVSCGADCVERMVAELELERFDWYIADKDEIGTRPVGQAQAAIWDFETLLEKLTAEHHPEFVYRGQVKDYGTLLPSGYRVVVDMRIWPITREGFASLHSRGERFRPLLPDSAWPEKERRRIDFASLCRAHLGYLLSQLFCQHCCLPTEALDVTDTPDIAAFFSVFDYNSNRYVEQASCPGVIFRIRVPDGPCLSLQRLKQIDFYSCPFFVSGVDLLNLLGRCPTESDAQRSLGAYFAEKNDLEMRSKNWEDVRTSRPLELIAFPEEHVRRGRVAMQRAGLVFPDSLLPRSFEERGAPLEKTWNGPLCVEELATSDAVETFYFRHDTKNKRRIKCDPAAIFPDVDPLRSLLSGLLPAMGAGFGFAGPIVGQDASVFTFGDGTEDLPR